MTAFFRDLLQAARQFRRSPEFFFSAALLIALSVAANTQIFTLVNIFLLRPLPVRDPGNLIQLFEIYPRRPPYPYFHYGFYRTLAERSSTLFQVMGKAELILPLERNGVAERVYAHYVTDNFFRELGVQPLLGRVLGVGDSQAAVLSYGFWVRAFGRDRNVVGQTVRLKDRLFRIVGVVPERFSGIVLDSGPDLWTAYSGISDLPGADPNIDEKAVEVIARLQPGVSRAQAEQETAALWTRYMEEDAVRYPENYRGRINGRLEVWSVARGVSPMRDQSGAALAVLLAGTGLLLLMVCANIGGLLLARATAREKETAVRLAVGASRWQIVRQGLAESVLLTLTGGSIGIFAAYSSTPLLLRWLPPVRGLGNDPAELRSWSIDLHSDFRVLAFSVGICALTALLAALAPAWNSARHDLSLALRATLSDRRHQRLQAVMCAVQVALCTVLLIFAALMGRTLSRLRAVGAGFDRDRVAVFSLDPHVRGYTSRENWAFQQRLLEGVRAARGVEAAGIALRPLMRGIGVGTSVVLPGQAGEGLINTSTNGVTPGYFDVMGMHLIAGRDLTDADRRQEGKIINVVVNEAFARRFFAGQNPLGKQFATGRKFVKPMFEIVGVVNDTKYRSLREIPPPIFYSYDFGLQQYPNTFVLHIRTYGDPRAIIQPIRNLVQSIDPAMPIYQAATLSEEMDRSLWQERSLSAVGACFGAFAAVLAGVGIYGILVHFVAGRRREIGVRMALGARAANLIWLVAARVLPPIAGGMTVGAIASLPASTWVRSLLYGVEPSDARSSGAAVVLLLIISAAAAAGPVWRTLRLHPAATLRQE